MCTDNVQQDMGLLGSAWVVSSNVIPVGVYFVSTGTLRPIVLINLSTSVLFLHHLIGPAEYCPDPLKVGRF
jgi:hypothetical protein